MRLRLVRDLKPLKITDVTGEYGKMLTGSPVHLAYLQAKLLEESGEVFAAMPHTVVEELADVVEVCIGIARWHGFPREYVFHVIAEKFLEFGGFSKGITYQEY